MDAELEARARGLLAQASVIAEASASRLDSHKSKGKPSSMVPRIGGTSTFDFFAQRIAGCRSDKALQEVVSALEAEIEAIRRYTGKGAESKEQFRFRLLDEHEGKNYRMVAHIENVSVAYVRKIREADGRTALDGRKLAA